MIPDFRILKPTKDFINKCLQLAASPDLMSKNVKK